ncbi:hypothetical protein KUH03_07475 [Sphingobacterium sp. E70]|nr:GH32 C-terminal domain-containing protein [Sphingobacterium sp. E70]ULT26671.1 hypothetical protein KUH03_07475 [Sphingobacterium sp. E70]
MQEQLPQAFRLEINKLKVQNFKLILSNAVGNELVVGYDKGQDAYYIDRSKSGEIAFNADFPKEA